MRKTISLLTVGFLLSGAACPAFAVLLGPGYPAPGNNGFSSTGAGSGASGLAEWNYFAFDTGAFDELYFGLNQVDFGPLGAGLSGSALPMSFVSASGTTATWSVTTPYTSAGGPSDPPSGNYPIEFRMTTADFGPTPWIDSTTVGLPADVGVVLDNSAGSDFTLTWEFVADMGSGFVPLNSVPQGPPPPFDQTRSSVAFGFYHSVIPEPSAFLFGGLVCSVMLCNRRRNTRVEGE